MKKTKLTLLISNIKLSGIIVNYLLERGPSSVCTVGAIACIARCNAKRVIEIIDEKSSFEPRHLRNLTNRLPKYLYLLLCKYIRSQISFNPRTVKLIF